MKITIQKNLRKLRTQKGNTQEDLALHLAITVQAVSKWERDEGYPDITLLPAIAAYYNVTVDELLGVDEIRKEERISEILALEQKNANAGDTEANVTLMRAAYEEFPNDFRMIHLYMYALFSTEMWEYNDRIIALGDRILNECTNNEYRYSAMQVLCYTYNRTGSEKARNYANMLPIYCCTSNILLESVLQGEEKCVHAQKNIADWVDCIQSSVGWMLRAGAYTPREQIHAWETVVKIYEIVYEDGDMGFYHCRMLQLYKDIARLYAQIQNTDKTLESIALAQKHADIYCSAPSHTLTALLVDTLKYETEGTRKNYTHKENATEFLKESVFDFCRNMEAFRKLSGETAE